MLLFIYPNSIDTKTLKIICVSPNKPTALSLSFIWMVHSDNFISCQGMHWVNAPSPLWILRIELSIWTFLGPINSFHTLTSLLRQYRRRAEIDLSLLFQLKNVCQYLDFKHFTFSTVFDYSNTWLKFCSIQCDTNN